MVFIYSGKQIGPYKEIGLKKMINGMLMIKFPAYMCRHGSYADIEYIFRSLIGNTFYFIGKDNNDHTNIVYLYKYYKGTVFFNDKRRIFGHAIIKNNKIFVNHE